MKQLGAATNWTERHSQSLALYLFETSCTKNVLTIIELLSHVNALITIKHLMYYIT